MVNPPPMVLAFQTGSMPLKVGDIFDLKELRAHYKDGQGVVHTEGRMKLMREATLDECIAYHLSLPHNRTFVEDLKSDPRPIKYFEVSMD